MKAGTKKEVREYLEKELNIVDKNKDELSNIKVGDNFFIENLSFDAQITDDYVGNRLLYYIEAAQNDNTLIVDDIKFLDVKLPEGIKCIYKTVGVCIIKRDIMGEDATDTINDYNSTIEIPDGEFKSFKKFLVLVSNIDTKTRYVKLTITIYNKQTPIIFNHLNCDVIMRIVEIPNTDHKIFFKTSKEYCDDMLQMWKINIIEEWDKIIKEISEKASA